MIVCVCRHISDRDIEHAAHQGCASFEDLQVDLGVAVCCGCCEDFARDVLSYAQSRALSAHAAVAESFGVSRGARE